MTDIPDLIDPQRRMLAATIAGLRVIDLYVPNGATVGTDKYNYKLMWLEKVTLFIQEQLRHYPRLAVVGDFNIAPKDEDVHDPKVWEGQNLVSPEERAFFSSFEELGLVDSYRLFDQAPKSFSWWDYRMMGFRRNAGLRIDHIMISKELQENCSSCNIDTNPRKWEQPSDHAPVILSLQK